MTKDDFDLLAARDARISYSQFAEDLIVAAQLPHNDGFYVDVGCHSPFRYSNTALFHTHRNWRGINIDADPHAIELFRQARPNDINVHAGVGDVPGTLEFAIFSDGAVNSFDPDIIARVSQKRKTKERIDVPVRPLRDILDEHLPSGTQIDYMNIDCEGFDEKVVMGNDWNRYAPRLLTIEIHGLDLNRAGEHKIVRHLAEYGYRFKSHCMVSSIFEKMK